jgi:hypothetical protein
MNAGGFKDSENEPRTKAVALVQGLTAQAEVTHYKWEQFKDLPATKEILTSDQATKRAVIRYTVETMIAIWSKWDAKDEWPQLWFRKMLEARRLPGAAQAVCRKLLSQDLAFSEEELTGLIEETAKIPQLSSHVAFFEPLIATIEEFSSKNRASPRMRAALENLRGAICWANAPETKLRGRITALLRGPEKLPLHPGEAWSDTARSDLEAMPETQRSTWVSLFTHCHASSGGSPSGKWSNEARVLLKNIGTKQFTRRVATWLPLVNEPRTQLVEEWSREWQPDPNQLIIEPHSDILKGLAWFCGLREDAEIARALTALALSCYRKIPKKGPREVKVGNACVTALGMMPGMEGVGQLALLKVRVKFGTAQKMIEKALEATAARAGLPREELEEMAVPAYGLTEVGRCTETFGDYTAELKVTGTSSTEIAWFKVDGKRQQSVPAVVKEKFAEELKELQAAAKDIQRMLPAQRERIDNLFLQQKRWPFEVWRERYLDHPLVGVLARRLLWVFTNGKKNATGIWFNGQIVDIDLKPVKDLGAETTVTLWHPIGRDLDEIVGWRAWLDAQQIQQPFKQAHREVYVLTDAERRTNTYSNRFAAHLLKQHQFNALAALRGWKNKLRLLVDAEFPPATRLLPQWGLRAEFWIEGAGDDFGTDTNDTGTFLRVATDQVRFYPLEAAQRTAHAGGGGYHAGHRQEDGQPMPVEEVPALVFSEIMRDVDLFVGVASVGNDQAWADGGPDGRYRDYWQSYSFGELAATAQTRKEVLQRLVPRLKIAGQCSFADKFLVVKGSLRTYKIHLGSGNILMEPNDQYLCIVPDRGGAAAKAGEKVFLPFEGDGTLSIILSKAFLLADDAKIKDETIVRQITSK